MSDLIHRQLINAGCEYALHAVRNNDLSSYAVASVAIEVLCKGLIQAEAPGGIFESSDLAIRFLDDDPHKYLDQDMRADADWLVRSGTVKSIGFDDAIRQAAFLLKEAYPELDRELLRLKTPRNFLIHLPVFDSNSVHLQSLKYCLAKLLHALHRKGLVDESVQSEINQILADKRREIMSAVSLRCNEAQTTYQRRGRQTRNSTLDCSKLKCLACPGLADVEDWYRVERMAGTNQPVFIGVHASHCPSCELSLTQEELLAVQKSRPNDALVVDRVDPTFFAGIDLTHSGAWFPTRLGAVLEGRLVVPIKDLIGRFTKTDNPGFHQVIYERAITDKTATEAIEQAYRREVLHKEADGPAAYLRIATNRFSPKQHTRFDY